LPALGGCQIEDTGKEIKMPEHPRNRKGDNSMLKQILCVILSALIVGWVGYVSSQGIKLDTRVAVQESITSTIKEDVKELKGDMKVMIGVVQEIRSDQIRRTNKENGRR
jgi:hypothetical protein